MYGCSHSEAQPTLVLTAVVSSTIEDCRSPFSPHPPPNPRTPPQDNYSSCLSPDLNVFKVLYSPNVNLHLFYLKSREEAGSSGVLHLTGRTCACRGCWPGYTVMLSIAMYIKWWHSCPIRTDQLSYIFGALNCKDSSLISDSTAHYPHIIYLTIY